MLLSVNDKVALSQCEVYKQFDHLILSRQELLWAQNASTLVGMKISLDQ